MARLTYTQVMQVRALPRKVTCATATLMVGKARREGGRGMRSDRSRQWRALVRSTKYDVWAG